MKRLFRIDESEKNRILGMHKTATTKQYLKEQEEEETTDGSQTGQTENEEVVFDCEKINEVLEKPEVKNWIEKITGPAKWTIRRGGQKLAEKDVYKGVIDVINVIQCKLGLNPDGIFGNDTLTKLKEYQREQKIKDDGIVGDITWCKMFPELCDDKTKDQSGDQGSEEGTDGTDGSSGTSGSSGDGNVPGGDIGEMKKCLDQFDDSKVNSKVKGGVPKLIQGIDYIFFDNNRFAILESTESIEVKGNWKCEGGKVMIKVTTPYKGPWVIIPQS